jgi:hypothetical protein
MKMNTIIIKNERRTKSPKWCISTFKQTEETEVDQEER